MKIITAKQAKEMKANGYTFKPHCLYQNEKTAVIVVSSNTRRAYQVVRPK